MYCYRALKKQNIEVWLSLVEHHVRDVGAAGSNPVTSTKKDGFLNRLFLLMIYKKEQMINACFMRLSLMFFVSDFYVMRIVIELR